MRGGEVQDTRTRVALEVDDGTSTASEGKDTPVGAGAGDE